MFHGETAMRSMSGSLPSGWQAKAIVVLSLLLAASPWLLGYADLAVARWNAIVVAVIVAAGALAVILYRPYWPAFVAAFMAFWLSVSPRILTFADHALPAWLAYTAGAVLIVLALWAAVLRSQQLLETGNVVGFEPPVKPPSAPHRPRKAA